ncbi:scaffolding protein [Caudoviricetes sp.]|jgi:hypothetical protein|nr:scaffolding protein [Caudoviricetes sp.]
MNVKKAVSGDQDQDDDNVLLDDEQNQDEHNADENNSEGNGNQGDADDSNEDDDENEVVVSIGEEAPPTNDEEPAPKWVRELRKNYRELQREKRELEEKLKSTSQTETKPVALGKKPTLEDHDYDSDAYEAALTNWFAQKRQVEEAEAKAKAEAENQQKTWQAKLENYGKAKAELKVKDFDDAEATVQESLSVTQQGIVLQGSENPALVIYALGKNPAKAKELSSITDPVKFAFAVAKLETQLKVTNRKAAPPPEKTIQGNGRVSGSVDSTLERLRADAERTGDFTKVMQYKRQKRQSS